MIEGWKIDAMEQLLGQLIVVQRAKNMTVEQLAEMAMDRHTTDGDELTPEKHRETLAICLAICLRRLAVVDVTTA